MMLLKLLKKNLKLFTFTGLLTLGLIFPSVILAQQSGNLSQEIPSDWSFTPPSGIGDPDNTEGGATRGNGSCLEDNQSIALLVPPLSKTYTTNAYPTFSWYLPSNNAYAIKFVLYDEDFNIIYNAESNLEEALQDNPSEEGQIMSITLPQNFGMQPLEISHEYTWEVSLICDNLYSYQDIKTESKIERVPLNNTLARNLQGASLEEQVALYANSDPYPLWIDTLDTLMSLRRLQPNNIEVEQAWIELLRSAELEDLTNLNL